ncbi:MAG: hypothetical protein QXS21_01950 [Thermoproteota archaeon]|nr:hypothetical protein [Candidatus Brockarchaeota archaeon]MBO3768246.1 hypothetical protein [Candidatus Brockarchaeota archaeon]MBO3801271.1 hypothetical protein [Candidatus Brockarchaeota archaeon]
MENIKLSSGIVLNSSSSSGIFIAKKVYENFLNGSAVVDLVYFPENVEEYVDFDSLLNLVAKKMELSEIKSLPSALSEYASSFGISPSSTLVSALSYSFKFGVEIPYKRPVRKFLIKSEDFELSDKNMLSGVLKAPIFVDFDVFSPFELALKSNLLGEWYVTRVEGYVYHKLVSPITDTSPRTGLSMQVGNNSLVWSTDFYSTLGTVTLLIRFFANVPNLSDGDLLFLRGDLDKQLGGLMVKTLINATKKEVWFMI